MFQVDLRARGRTTLRFAFALVAAAISVAPAPALADVVEDVQVWTPTTFQKVLGDQWFVQAETQVRFVDDASELQNSLFRPALGYRVTPKATLFLGYAWVPYFYPARRNEQRIWQQLLMTIPAGGWTLMPRVRFEQRFLPGVDGVSLRLRGSMRVTHPVASSGRFLIALSDEVFFVVNSRDPAPDAGFAQNRLQSGLGIRVNGGMTVEPAYLFQFVNRPLGLPNEIDHVFILTTNVRF